MKGYFAPLYDSYGLGGAFTKGSFIYEEQSISIGNW